MIQLELHWNGNHKEEGLGEDQGKDGWMFKLLKFLNQVKPTKCFPICLYMNWIINI